MNSAASHRHHPSSETTVEAVLGHLQRHRTKQQPSRGGDQRKKKQQDRRPGEASEMSLQSPTSTAAPAATRQPASTNLQQEVAGTAAATPPAPYLQPAHPAPPQTTLPVNPDTRTHVVGELYDTERSYVESLQILVEKYMKPLKSLDSNRILIESSLVDEIFYTIPEILEHHENFLSALQDRLTSDWDTSQVIGDVFIEAFTNQQIIDTYTAFINNWKNARQAIKLATQAKPAFERYLEAMSREHRNKLTLDALLIMPVQRIPRYELLIKELLKHTSEDHPDYELLIEAQKEIHELALKIDRAEKEMLHQEQLKDLESLIEGHIELQHPQRDFIRYDLVTMLGASALTVAKKERVLFLFCDLLIMTSIKKKASRRSNLQTAFANSSNDLSLLEGNKFKLLLRVSLDQIEIRLETDQAKHWQQQHQQQQQQEQQQQLQLQKQLIQERKREIESDLYVLHQIESLTSKVKLLDRSQLSEAVNELSNQLRQNLSNLEQSGDLLIHSGTKTHHQSSLALAQATQDLFMTSNSTSDSPSLAASAQVYTSQSGAGAAPTVQVANQLPQPLMTQFPAQQHQGAATAASGGASSSVSSISPAANLSNATTSQQESNTSLEFVISNNSNANGGNPKDLNANQNLSSPSSAAIGNEPLASNIGDQTYAAQTLSVPLENQSVQQIQQQSNCETLVVTFASIDRRQAFLQAFIEAKQQRYQLQQQQQQRQQQQQHRIYSSSITLQLAQPKDSGSLSRGKGKLQSQENADLRLIGASGLQCPLSNVRLGPTAQVPAPSATTRISSAPMDQHGSCGQQPVATIVHQMSAPQSLALASAVSSSALDSAALTKERSLSRSQCATCSSNASHNSPDERQAHHHHHHYQLMHQPASHPASLHTFCCNEQHREIDPLRKSASTSGKRLNELSESLLELEVEGRKKNEDNDSAAEFDQTYYENMRQQLDGQQQQSQLHQANSLMCSANNQTLQLMSRLNQTLMLNPPPRYLATLPMNFLSTQHPALQFTCSTLKRPLSSSAEPQRRQTVQDNLGQLWLCMSNGYISHIALIAMRRRKVAKNSELQDECRANSMFTKCYNILPVIQSAGDICKSNINCAAQVRWSQQVRSVDTSARGLSSSPAPTDKGQPLEAAANELGRQVEVAIKPISPPVDIKQTAARSSGGQPRLSESAPAPGGFGRAAGLTRAKSSATKATNSATHLGLPPQSSRSSLQIGQIGRSLRSTGQPTYNGSADDRRRTLHDSICQRHYHHSNNKNTQGRYNLPVQKLHHHSHSHHHHHHHGHHQQHGAGTEEHRLGPDHHHYHQHLHSHGHHIHNAPHKVQPLYNVRHYTVPIAELRRALERQNKISDAQQHDYQQHHFEQKRLLQVIPPTNSPADFDQSLQNSPKLKRAEPNLKGKDTLDAKKITRAVTPPGNYSAGKSFRSARLLRHQASLKTSSILAKLVGSKHSSYLRKSNQSQDIKQQLQSDADDNDTDTDSGNPQQRTGRQEDTSSIDSNILAVTMSGAQKCLQTLNTSSSELNQTVISPLSSVSSLNSTNSSMTINSVCASSPNRSTCDLLVHSASATCCVAPISSQAASTFRRCTGGGSSGATGNQDQCGFRSRSATVPCRAYYLEMEDDFRDERNVCSLRKCKINESMRGDDYKVSEIDNEPGEDAERPREDEADVGEFKFEHKTESSLWLGCDDGSLIIIDCLADNLESSSCNACDLTQKTLSCGNVHSEVKLNAPVCDISTYKDKMVLVALSNGQLAIFKRKDDSDQDNYSDLWSLTTPKLLTVAANELNSTSKLCLTDDEYLWYSYGRNIFVLNLTTLKLETTIMAPTNDLSLQFTMQSITIDNMVYMNNLSGVWISFRNSHLIQLYDVKNYKLLVELNLFEPINKVLSYGNEIIRQHKTACLKATALLNVTREHWNTLFIGTSAGIVLYLNISQEQLAMKEPLDISTIDWNSQVASLRYGHSGHVKFLHLIEVEEEEARDVEHLEVADSNNNSPTASCKDKEIFLVSGGTGADFYGPTEEQQGLPQMNNDEDCLNHLMLWKL